VIRRKKMSSQIDDKFLYKGSEYSISAIEFPERFLDIYSLGIKPKEFHTACYRGYIATFAINSENLFVLKQLYTNNGNDKNNKPPVINGKEVKISTPEYLEKDYKNYREYVYSDIDLIINYSGSIIIAKDIIRSRYINMGFQYPISYKKVLLLTFDNGKLIKHKSLSKIASLIRSGKIELPQKESDVIHWIDDCFDVSFFKKAQGLIKNEKNNKKENKITKGSD
jgi:hypothetical protein